MQKKEINKKLYKYAKRLVKLTNRISPKFEKNKIHKLRTTFKKLRAVLRWQYKDKKILKPFKKIYSITGELRNAQVLLKKVTSIKPKIPEFIKWLNSLKDYHKEEWKKTVSSKVTKKLLKNISCIKVKDKANRTFFSKRIKKIKYLLQMPFISDNTIHDIRKMIKDIQYVIDFLQKVSKEKNILRNINNLKYIEKQLGNYIDRRTALILLKAYYMQEKDPIALKKAIAIEQQWLKKKDIQKEQLLKMLNRTHFDN